MQTLKDKIEQQRPRNQELNELNIEEQCNCMKKVLYEAAEETVGIKVTFGT